MKDPRLQILAERLGHTEGRFTWGRGISKPVKWKFIVEGVGVYHFVVPGTPRGGDHPVLGRYEVPSLESVDPDAPGAEGSALEIVLAATEPGKMTIDGSTFAGMQYKQGVRIW